MTQPPPLPSNQKTLAYQTPSGGMPTAVQALIGCVAAGATVVGAGYLAAVASTLFGDLSNKGFFIMIGAISLITVGPGLLVARKLRRNRATLGWAIGIYIGLLLGALFWAGLAWLIAAFPVG